MYEEMQIQRQVRGVSVLVSSCGAVLDDCAVCTTVVVAVVACLRSLFSRHILYVYDDL